MKISVKKTVSYLFFFALSTVVLLNLSISKSLIHGKDTSNTALIQGILHHGSSRFPRQRKESNVWFNYSSYDDDRILPQMNLKPKSVRNFGKNKTVPIKTILVLRGNMRDAMTYFRNKRCPVNHCSVTTDIRHINTAEVVITMNSASKRRRNSVMGQIWVLYLLESPNHSARLQGYEKVYNWTATYRHDSDIVTPYEKFVPFNESVRTRPQNRNYAQGKTKKVAWFVSNCGARNGRMEYAKELGKYIQVDIYGNCGDRICAKRKSKQCFELLNKNYKFYLAFENSNCRDYITEKFFVNGLQNDVIPIVMGAAPEDYKRIAPPMSYIHVDEFESPKELAKYLYISDKTDNLYNKYFEWKGTGSFIDTIFWCRLCAMAHEAPNHRPFNYNDIEKWWRGPEACIGRDTWRKTRSRKSNFIVQKYRNYF